MPNSLGGGPVVLFPVRTLAFVPLLPPAVPLLPSFEPVTNEPVFGAPERQYCYPTEILNPSPLPTPEIITVDKWFRGL